MDETLPARLGSPAAVFLTDSGFVEAPAICGERTGHRNRIEVSTPVHRNLQGDRIARLQHKGRGLQGDLKITHRTREVSGLAFHGQFLDIHLHFIAGQGDIAAVALLPAEKGIVQHAGLRDQQLGFDLGRAYIVHSGLERREDTFHLPGAPDFTVHFAGLHATGAVEAVDRKVRGLYLGEELTERLHGGMHQDCHLHRHDFAYPKLRPAEGQLYRGQEFVADGFALTDFHGHCRGLHFHAIYLEGLGRDLVFACLAALHHIAEPYLHLHDPVHDH